MQKQEKKFAVLVLIIYLGTKLVVPEMGNTRGLNVVVVAWYYLAVPLLFLPSIKAHGASLNM